MPYTEKQIYAWKNLLCNPQCRKILFDGGARSGKTTIIVEYFFLRALQYPGSRQLMARKYLSSAKSSLWKDTIRKYCRTHPEFGPHLRFNESDLTITIDNGSSIVIRGLDNNERVEKILGTEYITVFLNEATELSYDTMQMVVTRLAQKCEDAKGRLAAPKLLIDCNPRGPRHWLYYVGVKHVDPETEQELPDADNWARLNWSAYDNRENLTREYLSTLESLPEVKRDRMLNGIWRDNEGGVYPEFEEETHVIEPFEIPSEWKRIRAIDFGFTNPFVCLWGALDGDGRLYVYRELYRAQTLTTEHAATIQRMSKGERILYTVADHDAEERAELERAGIRTSAAQKEVLPGIEMVKKRLLRQEDGKPRLYFFKTLKNTLSEIYSYEWLAAAEGRNAKEEPRKESDHAMDALRYMVRSLENEKSLKYYLLNRLG